MLYHIQILKGIFRPSTTLYQLQKAETTTGLGKKVFLLYFIGLLVFGVSTFFGVGTESYSGTITDRTAGEFEAGKILLLGGKLVLSLLYTTFFLWFSSFVFWLIFDIPYKKLVIVQMFVLSIHFIEKMITYPILILFDLDQTSNPFSLGVISQYVLKHEYWINFFGSITLFHILAISILFYYLSNLSNRKKWIIMIVILFNYLFIWLFHALTLFIEIPILLREWW